MTIQTKEEINAVLGKYGFLESADKKLLNKIGYLGGIPEYDNKLATKKRSEYLLNLEVRPNGLEITIGINFTNYRVALFQDQIDFFVIEPQKQIVEKKSKSIVGRALLGGVLLGPVGAIVGGMTGIGNKDVKITQVDNILTIKLTNSDTYLTFSVDNKHFKDTENYLKKHYKTKYKSADELEKLQTANSSASSLSIADELLKLKTLLDNGILTQEEFDDQKQKLLQN
jgi:hypothetical protein